MRPTQTLSKDLHNTSFNHSANSTMRTLFGVTVLSCIGNTGACMPRPVSPCCRVGAAKTNEIRPCEFGGLMSVQQTGMLNNAVPTVARMKVKESQ